MAAYDYDLPEAAVAQRPVEPRDAARLLVDGGPGAEPSHLRVHDLPSLVGPGDLLVVNVTRVRHARLALVKPTGGAVEVLLLARGPDGWEALVRPGRRVPPGTVVRPAEPVPSGPAAGLAVEVGEELGEGRRRVLLHGVDDEAAAIAAAGRVPLPPYVHEPLADPERYQTVFARPEAASVAAPTAGLHLTAEVLDRCRAAGAEVAEVELEVGLGTFRPIEVERLEDHRMHEERYRVPEATLDACGRAERVLAVGTTAVRALEAAAATGEPEGSTELFLRPGAELAVVDALLTNFHLPRSTLLALVDLVTGGRWRELYRVALAEGYRFLSFGDAMLVPQVAEGARRPRR